MAKAKNWAVTSFDKDQALLLVIDGIGEFTVTQFTASFAKNEVPRCTCMVAIGRDARSQQAATKAKVHSVGLNLTQMKKATVYFEPGDDWKPGTKQKWKGRKVVFEGYYLGLAYRKVLDKVQPVMHLIHWLADLGFSSTMCSNFHPSVPSALGGLACLGMASGNERQGFGPGGEQLEGGGANGLIAFLGNMSFMDLIDQDLDEDLWKAIKSILCDMAQDDKFQPGGLVAGESNCIAGDDWKTNDRAARALKRIEGPGSSAGQDCLFQSTEAKTDPMAESRGTPIVGFRHTGTPTNGYYYAKPLKFDLPLDLLTNVRETISQMLSAKPLESYLGSTFWDALLLDLLPEFGLAIIPLVDRALVVADCPGMRTAWKKDIKPDDYDAFDWSGMLTMPLWGIGLMANHHSCCGVEGTGGAIVRPIGGGFVAQAEEVNDGMLLVQEAPAWLNWLTLCEDYSGTTTGIKTEDASRTMTSDTDPPKAAKPSPSPDKIALSSCDLLKLAAQQMYIENMLRGRSASISGKLRFDIAPGSIVQVTSKPEQFEDGVDELAVAMFGQVNRVTININAEAHMAGTSFQLTHIRTDTENKAGHDRTSIDRHPLFGTDIYVGAPLVDDDWLFEDDDVTAPVAGTPAAYQPGVGGGIS